MAGPNTIISLDKLEQALPLGENVEQYQHNVQGPYHVEYYNQKVAPKLEHRPDLDILHKFLVPNERNFSTATNHRLSSFDVKVIHISASGEVGNPISCIGVNGEADFQRATRNMDKQLCGTIIIAEGLSAAMINTLGMQYDLEPEFFAFHLEETEHFHMGKWLSPSIGPSARSPIALSDCLRKAPHYTVSFRRPCHIPGGFDKIVNLRSTTSTPRGVHILKESIPDVFISEKISVYKRKGSNFGILHRKTILDQAASGKANMRCIFRGNPYR